MLCVLCFASLVGGGSGGGGGVRAHPQRARTAGYIWSLLLSHLTLQSRACLHNVLSHTRTRTRTLTRTRKHSQAKKQILKDMALEQFEARSAKKTSRKSAAASPSPTRGRKVRFTTRRGSADEHIPN